MFAKLISTLKQFITPYPISPDAPELIETVEEYIEEVVIRLHPNAWVQHITAPDYVWMHGQWVFRVYANYSMDRRYYAGHGCYDWAQEDHDLGFTFYFLPDNSHAFTVPVKGTDLFLTGEC